MRKGRRLPKFNGELDRPLRLVPRKTTARLTMDDLLRAQESKTLVLWHRVGAGKTQTVRDTLRRLTAEANEREQQVVHKLKLLMTHFGIHSQDGDAWRSLAIKLAETFLRGFQDQAQSGAPKRWGDRELLALKERVEVLVNKGHTARDACRILFPNQSLALGFPRCNSVSTMYRRYHQAKKLKLSKPIPPLN